MRALLIVQHSRTGGARQMAEAAFRAAQVETEVTTRLLAAEQAQAEDVLSADGYIFAAPENLAALSGEMKAFFDRTYYAVLDRVQGRPYALMICAGTDGEGAARQAARICTGWRLKPVADPLIVRTGAQTGEAIWAEKVIPAEQLARCEELGATMAAGLALGVL